MGEEKDVKVTLSSTGRLEDWSVSEEAAGGEDGGGAPVGINERVSFASQLRP